MRMQKVQFRIGQLAKQLAVEKFVIRFWEKEFQLSPTRSTGGQRFYTQHDLEQFQHIKELLYDKGFTIAGAKRLIADKISSDDMVGSVKTDLSAAQLRNDVEPILQQLAILKLKLVTLRDLL